MSTPNTINLSETFYSIQAEGVTTGIPSIFVRISQCNLCCGGPNGSLMKAGKSSWYCDTEAVWRKGTPISYEQLLAKFEEFGQIENICTGRTHLIWTGGEPTIPGSVKSIIGFMDFFMEKFPNATPYCEIETNGTLPVIEPNFYTKYIQQINCSPKLANSGMSKSMRINKKALEQVLSHPEGYLKFVISNESDMEEIKNDFIIPFKVHWKKVVLMPGLDNVEDAPERTRFIYEMGKKYGYRAVTRGHIVAYNMTTGV